MGIQQPLLMMMSALLLAVTIPTSSPAQENRDNGRSVYPTPPAAEQPTVRIGDLDSQLARWLMIDNQLQLNIARFAAERASDEGVEEYVDDLIAAHRSMLRRLGPIARMVNQGTYSLRAAPPDQETVIDRQRIRATAADEIREKAETQPVEETKSAARNTGQETGPT